jgi:hypothetical protein
VPSDWAKWPIPNNTCQFTDARAADNADYLRKMLGGKWIDDGVRDEYSHPVLSSWRWGGPEAFMHLNALAEDLRTLEGVPGLEPALHDLRRAKGYEPTRHVLRMAAMMARAGTRVLQLFEPSNDSIPDIEIEVAGAAVAVEAKQLTESEPSQQFRTYGHKLVDWILKEVLTGPEDYPIVQVIVKDAHLLPTEEVIFEGIRSALHSYAGMALVRRFKHFNVALEADPSSHAFVDYRSIHIFCPRSPKENLRIARRAEKSNKQLRSHNKDQKPGLLCLGLTEHQDAHFAAEVLRKKFKGSQLRGISGVILHMPARHEGPGPRMVLDLISSVDNPNALQPPPANIPIDPLGIGLDLFDHTPRTDAVSAYRVGIVEGTPKASANAPLGFKMVRSLTPEMLR